MGSSMHSTVSWVIAIAIYIPLQVQNENFQSKYYKTKMPIQITTTYTLVTFTIHFSVIYMHPKWCTQLQDLSVKDLSICLPAILTDFQCGSDDFLIFIETNRRENPNMATEQRKLARIHRTLPFVNK